MKIRFEAILLILLSICFASAYKKKEGEDPRFLSWKQTTPQFVNPPYNETQTIRMLNAAETSACNESALENWTCGQDCSSIPGFTLYNFYNTVVTLNKTVVPIAFVSIINKDTQEVVFAFRGTHTLPQLWDEFTHFLGVNYSTDGFNVPGAKVDTYFAKVYLDIVRPIVIANLTTLGRDYPNYTYTFTGHSLGGALATLAAVDGATSGLIPVTSTSPQLYTFGSPRVGDFVFASAVNNLIPVMFRIVHNHDPVPNVPLCDGEPLLPCSNDNPGNSGLWAWHVKQEIFYNEDSSSFKVCSETNTEDFSCSDKYAIEPKPMDHMKYLNHSMFKCE